MCILGKFRQMSGFRDNPSQSFKNNSILCEIKIVITHKMKIYHQVLIKHLIIVVL